MCWEVRSVCLLLKVQMLCIQEEFTAYKYIYFIVGHWGELQTSQGEGSGTHKNAHSHTHTSRFRYPHKNQNRLERVYLH
ncbi:hypothetical protein FKM82_014153 [Ascaphus truei]